MDRAVPHRDPESGRRRRSVSPRHQLTKEAATPAADQGDGRAWRKFSIVSAGGRRGMVSLVISSNSPPSGVERRGGGIATSEASTRWGSRAASPPQTRSRVTLV